MSMIYIMYENNTEKKHDSLIHNIAYGKYTMLSNYPRTVSLLARLSYRLSQ